jgi:hypothetical protein
MYVSAYAWSPRSQWSQTLTFVIILCYNEGINGPTTKRKKERKKKRLFYNERSQRTRLIWIKQFLNRPKKLMPNLIVVGRNQINLKCYFCLPSTSNMTTHLKNKASNGIFVFLLAALVNDMETKGYYRLFGLGI